jgi:hypothetical protein
VDLEALDFQASRIDPALYVEAGRQATHVLVWVDDILVTGLNREEIVLRYNIRASADGMRAQTRY